jgi:lysozyme family protein
MPEPFDAAIGLLLSPDVEGGYVNDPLDPGGETHWGISKRTYPELDIRNLRQEEAIEIYRKDFWTKLCCPELPPALAIVLFDSAVNQGERPAIEMLQASLGVVVDGLMGPATVTAARGMAKKRVSNTVAVFMSRRGLRYSRHALFPRYALGWFKRLFLFHEAALAFLA